MMLRMGDGRGTSRSRFYSGDSAGLWFFLIKRSLVGASLGEVDDYVV